MFDLEIPLNSDGPASSACRLVEEARRKNGAGLLDEVRHTIDELLEATDANGSHALASVEI